MKHQATFLAFATTAMVALPGCLVTQTGSLEVLNPKQAYGQSLAVVSDLHRENEAIEKRLASDLQAALSKRGLAIAEDPAKADLVVVPTLGRMRERAPDPVVTVEEAAPLAASEPVEASEPVIAAPAPEARPFNRFNSANAITRGDLVSRRAVPSARVPATAQQAGLLLTAYRAADYQDFGMGRQSLPPVWRIYVSQPAVQMKWKSVAVPLINAAASAAAPLSKSDKAQNEEGRVKREELLAEQSEARKERAKDQKPSEARRREAKPRANQDTNNLKDEETAAEKKPET